MPRSTMCSVALVCALLLPAPRVGAELLEWNQEKVTAAASALLEAAEGLRGALQRQPSPTLGQPGQRAFWALRDEMQGITSASRRLQANLSAGAGRDETFPTYRRILRSARRAARENRRLMLKDPVPAKIAAVADALKALRPFYEEEAPL